MNKRTRFIPMALGCMILTLSVFQSTVASSWGYTTVNGVTTGSYEVSSEKGSARFNIQGNQVEMTNFSFEADPSLHVMASIEEEEVVNARITIHDGDSAQQIVADGLYPESFTKENASEFFNRIYQVVLGADDEPISEGDVQADTGVLFVKVDLSDGAILILAREDSDQFIAIAFTTMEYGTQDIVDVAFDALKDESLEEGEEEIELYEQGYPAYSHELEEDPYYGVICDYLLDTYGEYFEEEDISLPYVYDFAFNESDPEDIVVWGNYQLYNYALRGTTLMTRSGGDFTGAVHLKEEGDGFVVTSMDLLEDGAGYAQSEEEIFGITDELWDSYLQSRTEEAELAVITDTIRWYSEDTGIPIEAFEDYGWDPYFLDMDLEVDYPDLSGIWFSDDMEMEIYVPDGSLYETDIFVPQEDGSVLRFHFYGQYEVSTDALYYWDGWATLEYGEDYEELGEEECGYLVPQEDGSLAWYSANDDATFVFEREG